MHYIKGIIWLLLSLIIGCANDAIMKNLGATALTAWQITFFRYFFATIFITPILVYKVGLKLKTNTIFIQLVRGVILVAAMVIWNHGLKLVPLSTATLLSFTVPIFVLALAPVFLKEKSRWQVWIATLACFIGAAVATKSINLSLHSSGFILIIAELLFATLDILYKKYVNKDSLFITIFYSSLIPALISALPAMQSPIEILSVYQIMLLLALGLGSNLILGCILMAYSYSDATSLAPYRYMELVISIGIGYLVFSEIPNLMMLFGGLIILTATLLVGLSIKNRIQ
jgi:S-adenosylmethionine uptake transporter